MEQRNVHDFKQLQAPPPCDPDPMDPTTLIAFCDGSAMKNGQTGCKAGWACVFPHNSNWNRAAPLAHSPTYSPSNNRAEYRGAIEAMTRANEEDPEQLRPLYICSDSELLINSMTKWVSNWELQGWLKSDGKPVKNPDLLKKMVELQGARRIIWRHVKAHTGRKDFWSKWNKEADQLAREQTHNSPAVPVFARTKKRSRRNRRADQSKRRTHERLENVVQKRRKRPRLMT